MNKTKNNRETLIYTLGTVCVFLLLLAHFLGQRTPIVNNGDDWAYISRNRPALPVWKNWNPARVLPESILPLCAHFAVAFVMPFCGDYLWSISIVVCVVLSACITAYVFLFGRLLKYVMKVSAGNVAVISLCYFIFHFRSWMSPWIASEHLFFSIDLNNYFFYLLPVLLNACLVLVLEQMRGVESFCENKDITAKGIFVLLVYLAMFSNMFGNCVLAVYSGTCLLENIWKNRKMSVAMLAKKNTTHLLIIILWCICAFFEINGGRANVFIGEGTSFVDQFKQTIWLLLETIERMDDFVFWSCIVAVAAGVILFVLSKKEKEDRIYFGMMIRLGICTILVGVYTVGLCAITAPSYVERKDVLLSIMFFVFVLTFTSVAYIIRQLPKVGIILPALVFIIGFEVVAGSSTFAQTNRGNTAEHALAVSRNMMEQILSADEAGMEEVNLIVPKGVSESNWPYPFYMGGSMHAALKHHEMIKNLKRIHIVPNQDYYAIFGIEYN